MPEWSHPAALLLLAAVPLLARRWLRRPRPALVLPTLDPLPPPTTGRARRALVGGVALRSLALACLALAAAGPRWPDHRTRIEAEGVAIQIVLDTSGSMAEADARWPGESAPLRRLDAARRALREFVAGRPGDLVGLTAFAELPADVSPLTLDHTALLVLADGLDVRPGEQGTNVGDAVAAGLSRLQAAGGRRKVLVLVGDGEHNVFRSDAGRNPYTPRQAAQLAAGLGVPVYTIDTGGDPAGPNAEARAAGRAALAAAARLTGGKAFEAADGEGMRAALAEIGRLEKQPVRDYRYRRYFEADAPLALAAAALLGAVLVLEVTAWRKVP